MTSRSDKALLPAGMQDGLPPQAAEEAQIVELLMTQFSKWGYERVKPPLMEFEESLLFGTGKAVSDQAFRVQDPVSQRMLALRPDMTLQVARIAHSRLSHSPRPLRLAYAGQVARVQSSQLRPERQFGQIGVELIGATTPEADIEVILMAAETLKQAGVENLSIDLGLPALCPTIIHPLKLDAATQLTIQTALDRKDASTLQSMKNILGDKITTTLMAMLTAMGPAKTAMTQLDALDLPENAVKQRTHLRAVVDGLIDARPNLAITLDCVESRGFEYHTGVTFAFFSRAVMGELGRGGRYEAGHQDCQEPATGFTLFTDTLMQAVAPGPALDRVFLPFGTTPDQARKLRDMGWHTIAELEHSTQTSHVACDLGCSHIFENGTVNKLDSKKT